MNHPVYFPVLGNNLLFVDKTSISIRRLLFCFFLDCSQFAEIANHELLSFITIKNVLVILNVICAKLYWIKLGNFQAKFIVYSITEMFVYKILYEDLKLNCHN